MKKVNQDPFSNGTEEIPKERQTTNNIRTMTRLYGFTRDHIFPYYCFGKKCYSFGVYWSKLRKCFAKYGFKTDADEVLHMMMHNSNPIRFFGIIKTDKKTMYDLLND